MNRHRPRSGGARLRTVALLTSASAGHLVYPALLGLAARRRPLPTPVDPRSWPPVTVLVPAYREAGVIDAKVHDLRGNGYGGDLEVLVVAEDPETAAAARRVGARVIEPATRLGKAQAINCGMAEATHEIVVLNDANNHLAPGSLTALVRHLADPAVGAVAGEKVEADQGGEEIYWRFESFLKQREWALGTTIGVSGELVALRRRAWEPIPPDISSDDLWIALDFNERGHAVAYEPAARSIDPPVDDASARWERRTRMLAGSLFVFWRKRALLDPRHGLLAGQIIGHRLWRSTVGPLSHLLLLASAVRASGRSWTARVFVLGHVGAAAALRWEAAGGQLPKAAAAPAQVLYLQLVALGGMARFLRGDRVLQWHKAVR